MQVNYKLPTQYADDSALNVADIKQVNIGIRPKSGAAGVYPIVVPDVTFAADAQGISHEPLAAFGVLAPGIYLSAAQTMMKAGGMSSWSSESPEFTIEPPKPNPPTNVSFSAA